MLKKIISTVNRSNMKKPPPMRSMISLREPLATLVRDEAKRTGLAIAGVIKIRLAKTFGIEITDTRSANK